MDYQELLKKQNELNNLNDRQIQERIVLELIELKNDARTIRNNVQFFFWVTLLGIIATVVFLFIFNS